MTERLKTQQKMRFVSAEQVARRAGVSRSAVSRAFTPGASVAQEKRERVLKVAEELGYEVNALARGVLANHSRLVGIVATNPEVGFRAHLSAALSKALIARGNLPVLINTGKTDVEMLAAQRTLIGHRAEAVIILSGSPPDSFLDQAQRNGQPLIVLGRSEPYADHVDIGNAEAATKAVTLFLNAGRRSLAVASSRSGTPSLRERELAFIQTARQQGVAVSVGYGTDADYGGGLAAARDLFATQSRPDAVFCVNDQIAFGAMDIIRREYGLTIPGDVAVIGFDDVPEADWLSYQLTTFRQDPGVMAKRAVELIDRRLADPAQAPIYERIIPNLVGRQSFLPAQGLEA